MRTSKDFMKKINFLLIIIIFIASILRLWQLGNVPPSPDWDEAALAYNAYSILETGRDEYGKFLPVVLRSFDDYKPALYAYLTVPSILAFDMNIFSVRLPSAIFGILTVFASYFLVLELFKKKDLALLSSFLLAISPWHIQFSRVAFEANVGLAFNVFAILFFLKGLKKPWMLSISAICMTLGIYAYQSEKVFVPLLALVLFFVFRKELFSVKKIYLIVAILIGCIFIFPMFLNIITDKNVLLRAKGVSIFTYQTTVLKESLEKQNEDIKSSNIIGQAFHNRRIIYSTNIISGYLSHYDINWLFIKGDLIRHHAPGMGLMYLWELPFFLIGIYFLLFGSFAKKAKLLIFLWFLIVPIPAAATIELPHAVRTINFLPTFQVFVAIGLIATYRVLIKNKVLKMLTICYLFFAIFNFLYYLNQYFVQQNYFTSDFWQFGYKQTVEEVERLQGKYKKVIVSDQQPLDKSYIFFLFYMKYPPQKYQAENNLGSGFRYTHKFGKYEFRPIEWNKDDNKEILLVGRSEDIKGKIIKIINYLNGTPAIVIAD